jgi:hypothetical protein
MIMATAVVLHVMEVFNPRKWADFSASNTFGGPRFNLIQEGSDQFPAL